MIELILLERVEKLGQMGQLVKVKPGFARNYLLPQKKAMRATKENLTYFETQRAQLEANNLQRRTEATEVGGKVEGVTVVIIRQAGESGQLYGSVSARDIADAVTAARRVGRLPQRVAVLGIGSRSLASGLVGKTRRRTCRHRWIGPWRLRQWLGGTGRADAAGKHGYNY